MRWFALRSVNRGGLLFGAVHVAIALAILGGIFIDSRYVSEDLSLSPHESSYAGEYEYSLAFLADAGTNEVANVHVRISSWENTSSLLVSIWHEEGFYVDRLSFAFQPLSSDAFWYKTPEGEAWPPVQLMSSGNGVVYRITDTGDMGTGTMNFEYDIRKDVLNARQGVPEQVQLHVDFTMRRDGILRNTSRHGEGDIYFKIP